MKRYKCKICKSFYYRESADQIRISMTPLSRVCDSVDCKTKVAMSALENKRKEVFKEFKENSKTASDYKKELQDLVNWIVKEIDKDLPCISHPEHKSFLRFDAGHFWGVGAHGCLRFNFHNIHKQNSEANQRYGGNADFANGLKTRFGTEYLTMVLGLPLKFKGTSKKFSIPNLNEWIRKATYLKMQIKQGETFTRDQLNEYLGIYE